MITYQILLHGRALQLLNERGEKQRGGVYVWRTVTAADQQSAIALACQAVTQDPLFLDEILNASLDELDFQAEEIRVKEHELEAGDSGFVFYIDEDEQVVSIPQ